MFFFFFKSFPVTRSCILLQNSRFFFSVTLWPKTACFTCQSGFRTCVLEDFVCALMAVPSLRTHSDFRGGCFLTRICDVCQSRWMVSRNSITRLCAWLQNSTLFMTTVIAAIIFMAGTAQQGQFTPEVWSKPHASHLLIISNKKVKCCDFSQSRCHGF